MPYADPDCPFCRVVGGADPDAREVYRDDRSVAFFPTEPAALGHTLLIPREHIPDIWLMDPDTAAHLGRNTVLLAHAVKRALNPDGLNVIQSNGEAATQTVNHLHVHIVPRWIGDDIGQIWPLDTAYTAFQKDSAWEEVSRQVEVVMRKAR